jgi:hypothetical protein
VNHYRLYHLDHDGRIRHAEWLSAASDEDALDLANLIRRSGFAVQELWLWQQRLAVTVLDDALALAA